MKNSTRYVCPQGFEVGALTESIDIEPNGRKRESGGNVWNWIKKNILSNHPGWKCSYIYFFGASLSPFLGMDCTGRTTEEEKNIYAPASSDSVMNLLVALSRSEKRLGTSFLAKSGFHFKCCFRCTKIHWTGRERRGQVWMFTCLELWAGDTLPICMLALSQDLDLYLPLPTVHVLKCM